MILRVIDVNWRRDSRDALKSLPQERKVLAERYTIDADEAERREQLAAEEHAREAAAEEVARRAAAEEAARREAAAAEAEAERRASAAAAMRAAAESARRAAEAEAERRRAADEESARQAAAEEAAREAAAMAMQRELDEQAQAATPIPAPLARPQLALASSPGPVEPEAALVEEPAADMEAETETTELPIYRWFGNG